MRCDPGPMLALKAVEHLARWRGAQVGVEAAEAFCLLRQLGMTSDPDSLRRFVVHWQRPCDALPHPGSRAAASRGGGDISLSPSIRRSDRPAGAGVPGLGPA